MWNATWSGYNSEYSTLAFKTPFTLEANKTYNYTIITGSYPQIIHINRLEVLCGMITCDSFVDVNGATFREWIPSIRLGEEI